MKKLRIRMISIVFLSSAAIFALTFFLVRGTLIMYQGRQADGMTLLISSYNGEVPELAEYNAEDFSEAAPGYDISISEESAFSTRYFVVILNENLEEVSADLTHVAAVDEDTAAEMAASLASGSETTGYTTHYRYRVTTGEDGNISVIFLDCADLFAFRSTITSITGLICILFPLLITLIFGFFSGRVLRPFAENNRRQKQFITDAGHELKTPLAVICANASVLEYKTGENEWLKNITDQAAHMGELIDDMLTLAKMDEYDGKADFAPVDISALALRRAGEFAPVFRQKNITFTADIAPDVVINGNEKQLSMLFSILTENASKYGKEGGNAEIHLRTASRFVIFETRNTADLAEITDTDKLFDRFYRPDTSRSSKTGGHGIGLSTAKKITELHGGSISARRENDSIIFTAKLRLSRVQ